MRNWCNPKGKPLTNIISNAQLEDIVRLQPTIVADFRKVSGIGEAKSKKYGTELLVLIHQTPASEGIRGKEASFVTTVLQTPVSQETQETAPTSGTEDKDTSGTGDTSMLGTENTQRNADET